MAHVFVSCEINHSTFLLYQRVRKCNSRSLRVNQFAAVAYRQHACVISSNAPHMPSIVHCRSDPLRARGKLSQHGNALCRT